MANQYEWLMYRSCKLELLSSMLLRTGSHWIKSVSLRWNGKIFLEHPVVSKLTEQCIIFSRNMQNPRHIPISKKPVDDLECLSISTALVDKDRAHWRRRPRSLSTFAVLIDVRCLYSSPVKRRQARPYRRARNFSTSATRSSSATGFSKIESIDVETRKKNCTIWLRQGFWDNL